MTARVTKSGLKAWILRNIGLQKTNTSCFHTYHECFRTLDGRVPFCLNLDNAFSYLKRDNFVSVSLYTHGGKVYLHTNTCRWDISVRFFSVLEDDDFENDIPAYAKAFYQPDRDGNLFSVSVQDPPTEMEIDRIHTKLMQLQRLRPCGCGQPAALSSSSNPETDFCVKCELTLTGTPEAVPDEDINCLICLENIIPGHLSILKCCGVQMHVGCREEYFQDKNKCPHCRSCTS